MMILICTFSPRVTLPNAEGEASIFDTLEDMNFAECVEKCIAVNEASE